jgi:hypothetical protein
MILHQKHNLLISFIICFFGVIALAACGGGESENISSEKVIKVLRAQATTIYGDNLSISSAATKLLDFAEKSFPEYFPDEQKDITGADFIYRYYPTTQIYIGIALISGPFIQGNVYVVGPAFSNTLDNPQNVGPITNYINVTNTAPVANAGVEQNVKTGALVNLDGTQSFDSDGDRLTYIWALTSKPSGSTAALSSSNSARPAFTADVAGIYVGTLTVNDGKVNSTTVPVSITVVVASVNNMSDLVGTYVQSITQSTNSASCRDLGRRGAMRQFGTETGTILISLDANSSLNLQVSGPALASYSLNLDNLTGDSISGYSASGTLTGSGSWPVSASRLKVGSKKLSGTLVVTQYNVQFRLTCIYTVTF